MAKKEKEVITLTIPEYIFRDFKPGIPYGVQVRNYLNEKGFKFKDDGKMSATFNENPEPLGDMKVERDDTKKTLTYTQTI